jgi:hypothetical protein
LKKTWLNAQKLQEEIYLIQRQLDQAKIKLITDIKVGFCLYFAKFIVFVDNFLCFEIIS